MRKTFILSCCLISAIALAQVGVNTSNPQAAFHIDAAKDNPITGAPTVAQQVNDLVMTSAGNLGVGTITPNANAALDINSDNKGVKLPSLALHLLLVQALYHHMLQVCLFTIQQNQV